MSNQDLVHRGGMLQRNEQLAQRTDCRSDQIPLPRPEFLIEFVRSIIKNNPNGDILYLSIMEAASKTAATPEEVELLKEALREVTAGPTPWPKGFFPEL